MSKNFYYLISLSGAYDSQSFWKTKDIEKMDTVLNKPASDCIYTDCTDILGSLYFCSDDARTELEKRLAYIPVNALHFIDSGDYHYVSLLFLQRINQPFSLLLFDHHSDCMESAFGGGLLTCGSWVLHALENLPNLKKAVLVGPADEDKTAEQLLKDSRITWVTESEFEQQKEALCKELLKWPVYISLDKDVLSKEEAVTDWSQGNMRLSKLFNFLTEAKNLGVVFLGMDVCGEQKVSPEGFHLEEENGTNINSDTNEKIKFYQKDLTFSL